jgi:hypothetical protein
MQNYLLLPFVEIEIRLGTLGKTFDSSIDKKYFNEIKTNLQNTQNIFSIETKQTTEYINKNIKLISKDKKESLQMKENVLNKTFSLNNSPFDIRLSINQEFSLNSYINSFSKNENIIRKKDRTSFIDKNYRYDLTIVSESNNGITKQKYEIEIELLVNKETLTWSNDYLNDFIECKIYDLINVVEPIERESFKLKFF